MPTTQTAQQWGDTARIGGEDPGGYVVQEFRPDDEDAENRLLFDVYQAYADDHLEVPAVPELAERIRRAVESATRLELAREASVDLILSQVREGNLRAALWVADRLGVTSWGYPTKKIAPQAADGAVSAEAASAPDSAPDSVPDPDRSLYLNDEGNCVASPHGTEFDLKFDQ